MADILIIEDDVFIQDVMTELLNDHGFNVHCCSDGEEGLDYLLSSEKPRPKVIFLDLRMPIMDGNTFLVKKRSNEEISAIPVVVMTADGKLGPQMLELQASRFLKKPLDVGDVLSVARDYCASDS
jgi:CheY-like chemotaxis protein